MKNMKNAISKLFITAFAVLTLTAVASAQHGRFSLGAELAMPMGDFGDAASIGFGGTLGYEHPIGEAMGIGLRAGYLTFSGKDDGPNWSMIPAQAFFKYYFGGESQMGFYAMANLGIHNLRFKTEDIVIFGVTIEGETFSETNLSYAPEIGYHMEHLDLGLRYQLIATEGSTTSYLGLRVAYVFGEH